MYPKASLREKKFSALVILSTVQIILLIPTYLFSTWIMNVVGQPINNLGNDTLAQAIVFVFCIIVSFFFYRIASGTYNFDKRLLSCYLTAILGTEALVLLMKGSIAYHLIYSTICFLAVSCMLLYVRITDSIS